MNMKKFNFVFLILISMTFIINAQNYSADSLAQQADQEATTIMKPGALVPNFSLTTLDGMKIQLSELKGKTVFLNFFALSCPICLKELPELEKHIWQKYKNDKNIVILCVGREETNEKLIAFRDKNRYTFPIAADIDRSVYSLFGTKYIPRNIIIDKEGKLVFTEVGYNKEKFESLIEKIESELKK